MNTGQLFLTSRRFEKYTPQSIVSFVTEVGGKVKKTLKNLPVKFWLILLSVVTVLSFPAFNWIRFSLGRRIFDETFSLYNLLDRLYGTHFNFALWEAGMLDSLRTFFTVLLIAMLLSVVILVFALIILQDLILILP